MRKQVCSEQLDPIVVFGDLAACKLERTLPVSLWELALDQGMKAVVEQEELEVAVDVHRFLESLHELDATFEKPVEVFEHVVVRAHFRMAKVEPLGITRDFCGDLLDQPLVGLCILFRGQHGVDHIEGADIEAAVTASTEGSISATQRELPDSSRSIPSPPINSTLRTLTLFFTVAPLALALYTSSSLSANFVTSA